MTALKERLFWMDLNNMGLDETGFLMTMDQLLSELPDVYDNKEGTWKDRRPSREDIEEWLDNPEDIYVNNKFCKGFTGEYRGNITFTVKEIESLEELKDLMTWKDFDYENGYTAVELDRDYPDFVPVELRLSMCVYGEEPGWTSTILPKSGDKNPTVAKYMEELGLSRDELFHKYSDMELAAIEISQALQDNNLTREEFEGITGSYSISVVTDIEWNIDNDDIMVQKNEAELSEQLEQFLAGNTNRYNDIKICDTPAICLAIGMEQKPMLYTKKHLNDALNKKHNLSAENIRQMPKELSDPSIIFDSLTRNDSIIIVTSELDNNGSPIIVAVQPEGHGTYNLENIDANFILSIYGKDNNFENYIERAAEQNKVLFYNKQKTERLFSMLQLQLPQGLNNLSCNCIIQQSGNIVNKSNIALPSAVVLPTEIADKIRKSNDAEITEEIIGDWLSDTYGFLHNGFRIPENLLADINNDTRKEPEEDLQK